ncbi:hypothetical protein VCHC64A1_01397A, partial [Vibrio cholerae HC-64A1]
MTRLSDNIGHLL